MDFLAMKSCHSVRVLQQHMLGRVRIVLKNIAGFKCWKVRSRKKENLIEKCKESLKKQNEKEKKEKNWFKDKKK